MLSHNSSECFAANQASGVVPAVIITGFTIIGSVIYDIATASKSARRYNENLSMNLPAIKDAFSYKMKMFEQPEFKREVLTDFNASLSVYAIKQTNSRVESPNKALYWSLGATMLPIAFGVGQYYA
jgi:hypothetical protein